MDLLKPKNDVVFHCLFRKGNEKITKALISSIIDEEIEELELDNDRYLLQSYPEQKIGILDLNVKLNNGVQCNIEVQLANKGNIEERIVYYWSRLHGAQLVIGNDYGMLQKTIAILIIDFELEKLRDCKKSHTKWKIREDEYFNKILTNNLEIHIIELPKAVEKLKEEKNNKLLQWMAFLDNPNKKGVLEMKKKNQDIADALWKLEEISEDQKVRRMAWYKEKWERDEISAQKYWKENGLEEGRREGKEQGLKQGLKQGLEQGLKEGIQEGIKGEQKKIVRKMKEKGMDIDTIIEITGLTKEEIEKIN